MITRRAFRAPRRALRAARPPFPALWAILGTAARWFIARGWGKG